MKNKFSKSDSVFKKRGFYVALYSCVGVVLVLAATISFSSLNGVGKVVEPQTNLAEEQPIEEASKSRDNSYLTPQDKNQVQSSEDWLGVTLGDTSKTLGGNISAEQDEQASAPSTPMPEESQQQPEVVENPPSPLAETEQKVQQTEPVEPEVRLAQAEVPAPAPAAALVEPVFKPFTEELAMNWPVLGEVVMDYSREHAIYDKTLEHYRTNNNICIAAQVGTQVKASVEGVVKSITNTPENGNMVIIDHGNGWETIYSQLQDNILVKEGDVVKTGQVIGGVASPSRYGVLLGNHLAFQVVKDNETVDPKTILAQ